MPKSPASEPTPRTEPPAATPESFEKALERLEQIVKELESGDLPLEKSLELFEKGMALSESCRKQLSAAETRVEILLRKEGKVEAAPFSLENNEGGNR